MNNQISEYNQNHDSRELIYNIGIGTLFSTVGAIINKKPNEKLIQVIKKAIWQGALGGYITFESKRLVRLAERRDNWRYYWAGKLVNSVGTSIKENASHNRDFYEQYTVNFGFNRIEFHFKNEFKVNYKILPIALTYTAASFVNHRFDFINSIKTGEFIFISEKPFDNFVALTYPGYFVYDKNDFDLFSTHHRYKIISHEIIHIYQSNDFSTINSYLYPTLNKIYSKSKFFHWFNKHIEMEFHYFPLRTFYLIEKNTAKKYYDNFFEHEAGYFSDTLN